MEDTVIAATTPAPVPTIARTPESPWSGAELDHYEVGALAGRGGMGAVYLGRDVSLDRRVAIKILPAEFADQSQLQQRFIREARAQARLQSARVAHIYHIGRTPPDDNGARSLYFAMEFVSGGSLDDKIGAGETLDPEQCRRWLQQAAEGLRDAQTAGIVHRDIKPGNLLLDHNGNIKIADFGVAKPVDDPSEGDERISRHGTVVGSPLYISPEQAKGLDVDFRADMYSLGCTFFEALTARVPYDGTTALSVLAKHMTAPIPPVRAIRPEVPRHVAAIVEKLLGKEPDDRFSSYDALIAAITDAAPSTAHAGFWARVPAALIDAFIGGLLIGFLGWPALLFHLVYLTVAHAWRGQTIGKYLMNLKVERTDGSKPSYRRSAVRTLASMWMPLVVGATVMFTQGFSELARLIEGLDAREIAVVHSAAIGIIISNGVLSLLYIAGLALSAFHPDKRAAHDIIAGTHVQYALKPSSTENTLLDATTEGG